jgi:hypothetical protein
MMLGGGAAGVGEGIGTSACFGGGGEEVVSDEDGTACEGAGPDSATAGARFRASGFLAGSAGAGTSVELPLSTTPPRITVGIDPKGPRRSASSPLSPLFNAETCSKLTAGVMTEGLIRTKSVPEAAGWCFVVMGSGVTKDDAEAVPVIRSVAKTSPAIVRVKELPFQIKPSDEKSRGRLPSCLAFQPLTKACRPCLPPTKPGLR